MNQVLDRVLAVDGERTVETVEAGRPNWRLLQVQLDTMGLVGLAGSNNEGKCAQS